jgi:predicted O-methyltransferase YrrM
LNPLRRLIARSELRKSRFHDEQGNVADLASIASAPSALVSVAAFKLFDHRPARPWISYRAVKFLNRTIKRDWRVVEFGSGMSTLWFAPRCGFLHSIESSPEWYELVSRRLGGAKHVRYELRSLEEYCDLSDYADASVDLAFVDGTLRARCVESVVSKIRPGGLLYVDNTDKADTEPTGDIRRAKAAALKASEARGGTHRYFVDFRPSRFEVTQGLLIQF